MDVLLVEDDDTIAEPLVRGLERQGFSVRRAADGTSALAQVDSRRPDIVLLDLGLPDIDGYEVCRRIRLDSTLPIIVVTARGDEIDRVLGLELGADDYMVKPFGFRELVARMNAVLRRTSATALDDSAPITLDPGLVLDPRSRRVTRDGEELGLTRKEYDLLALLASDPGAIHTRESILEQVWDANWYGPTKTLDVHIKRLRSKIEVDPANPVNVVTIRGLGYKYEKLTS